MRSLGNYVSRQELSISRQELSERHSSLLHNLLRLQDMNLSTVESIESFESSESLSDLVESQVECYGATSEELEQFNQISFILETIIQPIIGIFGLISNAIAFPILSR